MKIVYGDLWKIKANYKGITTNNVLNEDDALVMGKGVAAQAKQRYPGIEYHLAALFKAHGYKVCFMIHKNGGVFSFPTKYHWRNKSDLDLIRKSCPELKAYAKTVPNETFALPMPGVGNGQLAPEHVWSVLEAAVLPDNVILVIRG